jgi:hypothetical protein
MQRTLVRLVAVLLLAAPTAGYAAGTISLSIGESITSGAGSLSGTTTFARELKVSGGSIQLLPTQVVVELEEINDSFQSPHHNVGSFGVLSLAASVTGNAIATVQQTGGLANVTLGVNTIVAAGVLGGSGIPGDVPPIGKPASFVEKLGTNLLDPTALLSVTLNPGFAILNSKPVAQMLLAREAMNSLALPGTAGVLVDLLSVGLNEFSPHHNAIVVGTPTVSANVSDNTGVTTLQQQVGGSNVQAAVNTIIVNGTIAGGTLSAQ